MRVFYVLYVSDTRLRSALDTIRLLYNPSVSHSAHITVRGPYSQRINARSLSAAMTGEDVILHHVGHFFANRGNQHTVYFEAYAPRLADVWKKRDFGFLPHLTLYDGASRESRRTALELYQIVARLPIGVAFEASGLEPLISGAGQTNLNVLEGIDFDFVSDVTGKELNRRSILSVDDRSRIVIVEQICRYLSQTYPRRVEMDDIPRTSPDIGLASGWAMEDRRGRGQRMSEPAGLKTVSHPILESARPRESKGEDSDYRLRDVLDGLWSMTGQAGRTV